MKKKTFTAVLASLLSIYFILSPIVVSAGPEDEVRVALYQFKYAGDENRH
ncbi:MAG: hypothetical protein JRJ39_14115 [Deltaproteobacteria bacterium]|nr:hypothetical protein [Deltaproteobacteria bacterium]